MEESTVVERKWNEFISATSENGYIQYCLWANLIVTVFYWSMGSVYVFLDVFNPAWSRKYKVQAGKNEPVDQRRLAKVLLRVVFNQIIVGPVFVTVFYPAVVARGMDKKIRPLPTVTEFAVQMAICVVIREFYFYYSHRILHMRQFYERIHKKHHEWAAPIAVSAIYCSPLEHVWSNIGPVSLGPFLLGSHYITALAFSFYAILMTLNDHSGYHFPHFFNPKWHDYHHEK